MNMNKNISEIINVAAVQIVKITQDKFSKTDVKKITQKKDGSFVTQFDVSIDQALTGSLKKKFPQIKFISEEIQSDESDLVGLAWCIDPIDGTHNFMMDIPYYAVSVGLLRDGKPIAGIIYNPVQDQLLVGGKGTPVKINGSELNVSNNSLVVTTNRSHEAVDRQHELDLVSKIFLKPELKYRRFGSCALDIMNLVLGSIGGTYIIGNSKWDWSAGYAIAESAGLVIRQDKNMIIIHSEHISQHMVK